MRAWRDMVFSWRAMVLAGDVGVCSYPAAKCGSIVARPQSRPSGSYVACSSSYCRRPSEEAPHGAHR